MAAPVVLLHGFTQTSDCWGPFGEALALRAAVEALDLPGHGHHPEVPDDLWGAATSLVGAVNGRATWIGYSMGGRIALHLALAHPERVDRLVLISATPGIEHPTERARRRADDEALAGRLEAVGVDAFVEEWTARPMFASVPPHLRCLEARRTNSMEGLAASLRRLGTGHQEPLWDRLVELEMPVVAVAGARDAKFAAIAERMAACSGGSIRSAVVADAGHAVHLERPEATLAALGP